MSKEQLVKIKRISPAYDKRDPDPNKNYGIGSETELYAVVGEIGAVTFGLMTDRFLPHVAKELGADHTNNLYPMATGIDYHFYICPVSWKEYIKPRDDCFVLGGKPCFCDGSSLAGDDVLPIYKHRGEAGVFMELERRYFEMKDEYVFEKAEP